VILPGLVNTHHHLFQTLTRCLPAAQSVPLEAWHRAHYPFWAQLTAEALHAAARLTIAELIMSGCTTTVDHLTAFPNDVSVDPVVSASQELGIRLVIGRGGRTGAATHTGGQAPPALSETEDDVLQGCIKAIDDHHDARRHAMTQVVVAPSHPLSVTEPLGLALSELAQERDVGLHTHLHETAAEVARCVSITGVRPLEHAAGLGWLRPKSWFAHGVHFTAEETRMLATAGSGISHCPSSNMRLGSGIADVPALRAAGVAVGLGSDGGASNDSSNMLSEARMALLLHRVAWGAGSLTPAEALGLATRGGAAALSRDELGALAPGMAADLIGIRRGRPELAGVVGHVAEALTLCVLQSVDLSVINGRVRVLDGTLMDFDWELEAGRVQAHATRMVQKAHKTT
jgi:8-oxoguanine deaminase